MGQIRLLFHCHRYNATGHFTGPVDIHYKINSFYCCESNGSRIRSGNYHNGLSYKPMFPWNFYVYQQPSFVDQFWGTLLATAIGIIIGCYITIFDRYNFIWIAMRLGETLADYWSRIAVMFMIIHALLFTSNSFTIWEDRIVAFLLSTFGMLTLYEFVFLPKRQSTTALLTATISEKEGTTSGVNPSQQIQITYH